MYLLKSCFVSLISLRYCQTVQYGGNVVCSERIPLLFDLLEPGICLIHKAHPADVGSGQVVWACTGKNKTLPPSTSLPVMGEIAGVRMASVGGYFPSSKTRASWRMGSTMNWTAWRSTGRGKGSVWIYLAREPPYDGNWLWNDLCCRNDPGGYGKHADNNSEENLLSGVTICVCRTVEQWFCFYVVCILPNFSPEGTLCNFAKMGLFSLLAMQSAPCRVDRVSWIFPYCGTCLLCSLTCWREILSIDTDGLLYLFAM